MLKKPSIASYYITITKIKRKKSHFLIALTPEHVIFYRIYPTEHVLFCRVTENPVE
jgi:hypothetical protein